MSTSSADERILRDKRLYSRGRAKVSLNHLHYRGISSRGEVDDRHINHLVEMFQVEGCARLHDPNHHVPAIISPEELSNALSYSKLRLLDLVQDGEPYTLNFQGDVRIRVLHGEHRLRAAERFFEPNDQWWTVVLYTTQLPEPTQQTIREEYSHQLSFTDGDIYRKIRLYERVQNRAEADKWKARLSGTKARNFNRLSSVLYKDLKNAFDEVLPFIGLWDGFLLGSFNRLFYMDCPEELAHYIRHIHKTWSVICHDPEVSGLVDGNTVRLLETLTPEASADQSTIRRLAQNGDIFSGIDRLTVMEQIIPRLFQVQGRIPSFFTFFEDTIYLEACIKSLRPLLPPKQKKQNTSFRQSFYRYFTDVKQSPGIIKIQTNNSKFRRVRGETDQRKEIGYLTILLAAMRDFPVLSRTAPLQSHGEKKPLVGGSIEERQPHLALLALEMGFDSPQIQTLANEDPDIAAAKEFIHWYRPTDQYEINHYEAEELAQYIAGKMRVIASPKNRCAIPEFAGVIEVTKKLRCGLPDNITYKKDRNHLFLDTIYNYKPPSGQHLTSLAFQRDIFVCFFGLHSIPQETREPPEITCGNDGEALSSATGLATAIGQGHAISTTEYSRDEGCVSLSSYDRLNSFIDLYGTPGERQDTLESSNYNTRSSSILSSRPISNFHSLRSIEAAILPHNPHSPTLDSIATGDNKTLAPGFERSTYRKMNVIHALDDSLRPSEAIKSFLCNPRLIVVYLWCDRKYIKFWGSQRLAFEETMCSLADRRLRFAIFQGGNVVITGLNGLWEEVQDCKLVLAGPKSARTQHDAAGTIDNLLHRIDER